MAEVVYVLCALMSVACAAMLFRGYRHNRTALLLWSSLCFGFLALSNVFLFVDMMILPHMEFNGQFWRNLISACAGSVLLFGLIWEIS